MLIVLLQQVNGEKHVVDVVEDEGMLIRVLPFLRQERNGVITPVTKRIKVVRCVVAVIVAVPVALLMISEWFSCISSSDQGLPVHR